MSDHQYNLSTDNNDLSATKPCCKDKINSPSSSSSLIMCENISITTNLYANDAPCSSSSNIFFSPPVDSSSEESDEEEDLTASILSLAATDNVPTTNVNQSPPLMHFNSPSRSPPATDSGDFIDIDIAQFSTCSQTMSNEITDNNLSTNSINDNENRENLNIDQNSTLQAVVTLENTTENPISSSSTAPLITNSLYVPDDEEGVESSENDDDDDDDDNSSDDENNYENDSFYIPMLPQLSESNNVAYSLPHSHQNDDHIFLQSSQGKDERQRLFMAVESIVSDSQMQNYGSVLSTDSPIFSSFVEPQITEEAILMDTFDELNSLPCPESPTASGVIALIEVLRALNLSQRCTVEELTSSLIRFCPQFDPVGTRSSLLDKHKIPAYLLARSCQGVTAQDLVTQVNSDASALARFLHVRFFCSQPSRDFGSLCNGNGLLTWLQNWLMKGAVPVVFINTQCAVPPQYPVPEMAWRHLLVTGTHHQDVCIAEPRQNIPLHILQQQLTSESRLLVRKSAIISHWSTDTDLSVIDYLNNDPRWEEMNVLGQVVCCLREMKQENSSGFRPDWLHHIVIPCNHKPGIALFVPSANKDLCSQLDSEPEFSLLQS